MKNPMIQALNIKGKRVSLNVSLLTSFSEEIDRDGRPYTWVVMNGGGGQYIASHSIDMTYDQFSRLVNDFYAVSKEEKEEDDDALCIDMYNPDLSNWRECMISVHRRNVKEMESHGWERYWAWQDDG